MKKFSILFCALIPIFLATTGFADWTNPCGSEMDQQFLKVVSLIDSVNEPQCSNNLCSALILENQANERCHFVVAGPKDSSLEAFAYLSGLVYPLIEDTANIEFEVLFLYDQTACPPGTIWKVSYINTSPARTLCR